MEEWGQSQQFPITIVEVTSDEAVRLNKRKLGLLGTIFTMTDDFFKKPFYSSDIEIFIPTTDEMEYINCKISSELELGIVEEETLENFQKSPVPCLDTMKIHIRRLIDWIVEYPFIQHITGNPALPKNNWN